MEHSLRLGRNIDSRSNEKTVPRHYIAKAHKGRYREFQIKISISFQEIKELIFPNRKYVQNSALEVGLCTWESRIYASCSSSMNFCVAENRVVQS